LIFKLYDTFGFPVDIVRDVVRDEGLTLDTDGFESCMDRQRKQSRSKISFTGISDAYRQLSASGEKPEFVGYGTLACEARVVLVVQDNKGVDAVDAGNTVEVVTTATPFYGEAGGQVGDHGTITAPGMEMTVTDTVKDPTGIIIHKGHVQSGRLENGQTVMLTVDGDHRAAVALNHTATHILHAALRHELGDHVKQAGSMVAGDRLRFDFTHFSQIDPDALERIETFVNQRIRQNVPVAVEEMDMDQAIESGATALFEEKYGDRVRVVNLESFSRSFAAAPIPAEPETSACLRFFPSPAWHPGCGASRRQGSHRQVQGRRHHQTHRRGGGRLRRGTARHGPGRRQPARGVGCGPGKGLRGGRRVGVG
jgi:alanyl-tRNA synthetase